MLNNNLRKEDEIFLKKDVDITIEEYYKVIEYILLNKIELSFIKNSDLQILDSNLDHIYNLFKIDNNIRNSLSEGQKKIIVIYAGYIGTPQEAYLWENIFLILEKILQEKKVEKDYLIILNLLTNFFTKNKTLKNRLLEITLDFPIIENTILDVIYFISNINKINKKTEEKIILFFKSLEGYLFIAEFDFFKRFFIIREKFFCKLSIFLIENKIYKKNKQIKQIFQKVFKGIKEFNLEENTELQEETKKVLKKIKKLMEKDEKEQILEQQFGKINNYIIDIEKIIKDVKQDIIGQEDIIDNVFTFINKTIFNLTNKPTVLFFAGQSGVGKTQLGKIIGNIFAGKALIYNLGNFYDKHSIATLLGAPAGYSGFNEKTLIEKYIENIKNKQKGATGKYPIHPVIIFDEIEKAHSIVQNVFLEMFDEGILSLFNGKNIDIKDAIIILTSNIGVRSENFIGFNTFNKKEIKEQEKNSIKNAIKNTLKPEIINRIDEFFIFNNLDKKDIEKIKKRKIEKLFEKMETNFFIKKNLMWNNNFKNKLQKIIKNEYLKKEYTNIRKFEKEIENFVIKYLLNYNFKKNGNNE